MESVEAMCSEHALRSRPYAVARGLLLAGRAAHAHSCRYAELSAESKNRISHRSRSLAKLQPFLCDEALALCEEADRKKARTESTA